MSIGATGVISVASNIIPAELKAMVDAFASGDIVKARGLHMKYYCLFRDLFIETNPIPIKEAMALKNMINCEFRLPLCPMSEKNRETLKKSLSRAGAL